MSLYTEWDTEQDAWSIASIKTGTVDVGTPRQAPPLKKYFFYRDRMSSKIALRWSGEKADFVGEDLDPFYPVQRKKN